MPTAAWINQPDALQHYLAEHLPHTPLGLDTEFMYQNTFYPQLALLQIAYQNRFALIDPLALNISDSLHPALEDTNSIVIMHSAGEDLKALSPFLPAGPGNLFDTQIAAAFAGMGMGLSYRALVATLVGVELDKGETRSDWMRRPLTASQLSYATLDVVHLESLYIQLSHTLQQRGYSAWHMQDCQRLKQRINRPPDPQPQHSFRSAAVWPHNTQARLRRILLWRDTQARALNRPRPWLLEDALVLSLAEQPPDSLAQLNRRIRGQRALGATQASALFEVLTTPPDTDEMASTIPIPAILKGEEKQALTTMRRCVEQRATELNLPAGLLCPRKILETYVVTRQWLDFLSGWRLDILKEDLSSILPD